MDIDGYTAIGKITARYYLLHSWAEMGCCTHAAEAKLPLLLHSRSPRLMENPSVDPPKNWNPTQFPQMICQNMKPFILTPLRQIPARNMPGEGMGPPAISNMNGGFLPQPPVMGPV